MTIVSESLKEAAEMAEFRFGIIAPVLQGLFPDASKAAYFKRISGNEFTLPDGARRRYSSKTFEAWLMLYKKGGLDALMPSVRADRGTTRALPDVAVGEIYRLKQEFPRLNATQIYNSLVSDSFIPATVSVDSVQRFIKANDLKSARNPNMRDRKAFEEDSFGKMWQADTCYIAHITVDGKSRQVYCIGIIDDHSRLVVGCRLFYNDNAYNFQKVLKDAVATYGIPDKLLVDNGAPYSNEQLSLICVAVGIRLIHTRVRDGASKGKCERFWRTLKETWLYGLKTDQITGLESFNTMLSDFIRGYNTAPHSGIGTSPVERFHNTCADIRIPPSREWLDDAFHNRASRKVRNDSTISIDSVSYDVPMQFIRMSVDVRYLPGDMDGAYILYDGTKFPIRRTDKTANCHTRRNNPQPLDYSKIGGGR